MFNNSGSKIKALAVIMFLISSIGSLILFIERANEFGGWTFLLLPASIICCFLINLFIYSFGDMCENIDLMRSNLYTLKTIMERRFPDLVEEDEEDDEFDEENEDEEDDEFDEENEDEEDNEFDEENEDEEDDEFDEENEDEEDDEFDEENNNENNRG